MYYTNTTDWCLDGEEWKDIVEFEGKYQISSFGRVRSLPRIRKGKNGASCPLAAKIMSQKITETGYLNISFNVEGSNAKKYYSIHRLVALHFISNPENKPTVNHIDSVKTNNHVSNLEWATHREQARHGVESGTFKKQGAPVISKSKKQEIYQYHLDNPEESIVSVARHFSVSKRTVGRIFKGEGVETRKTTRVFKDGSSIVEEVLSREMIEIALKMREEGYTLEKIANKINRSISQTFRIIRGESRKQGMDEFVI